MKSKTIAALHSSLGKRITDFFNKYRKKVSEEEYMKVMRSFKTPYDINMFMIENFDYKSDALGGLIDNARCPRSMLHYKKDDCDSYSWFAYKSLEHLGFKPYMIAIQFRRMKNWHVSCFFVEDGKLSSLDNWGYQREKKTVQGLFQMFENANKQKVSGCFFFNEDWKTLLVIEKAQMGLWKHSSAQELIGDINRGGM